MKVFDGHCDTLTRIFGPRVNEPHDFFARNAAGHIDLPRAREGGYCGGIFAIFISHGASPRDRYSPFEGGYRVDDLDQIPHEIARAETDNVLEGLWGLLKQAGDRVRLIRDIADFDEALAADQLAMVLHFEGAEALDLELRLLDDYYRMGLRSLGLVWSRPNDFAYGVPFGYPLSPEIGPGLSAAGRALVRRCNELGIVVDAAHLNERGFWDLAELSNAPLVVSHSAAHALCASTRNLTDEQIGAVAASKGLIGIPYACSMLRSDGDVTADAPIAEIVRHVAYVAERAGVDHVALGSDFDGTQIPEELGDVAGLPRLVEALRGAGFTEDELQRVCHLNWRRIFASTWQPPDPARA
ncbi:dipeptidase [bacterium]|nr:dipeptidase [bacterium]